MKWIGQHIWDFISRFRNDVYLEDLSTTTETNVLVVDAAGKVSKNTTTVGGDITEVIAGNGVSGGGAGPGAVTVSANTGAGLENYVAAYGSYAANHTQVNLSTGILVNQPVGSGGVGMLQQGSANKIDQWTDIQALTDGGLTKLLRNDGFGTISTGGAITGTTQSHSDTIYFNPTDGNKSIMSSSRSLIKSINGTFNSGTLNTYGGSFGVLDFGNNAGGTVKAVGLQSLVVGNTTGTTTGTGLDIDVTGSDTNHGIIITTTDGGNGDDLRITSSAEADDYFSILTKANGETDITTIDGGATAAHLNLNVDGNIVLDAAGDVEINADGGNVTFKDGTDLHAEFDFGNPGLNLYGQSGDTGQLSLYEDSDSGSNYISLRPAVSLAGNRIIDFPDAQGTVALTSDIPDESPTDGQNLTLKYVKKTLSQANMEALHSSTTAVDFPGIMVAAPGANLQIIPNDVWLFIDDGGTINNNNVNLCLSYGGSVLFQKAMYLAKRFHYHTSSPHDSSYHMPTYLPEYATNITNGINESLTLTLDGAIDTNSITEMQVHLTYYIINRS